MDRYFLRSSRVGFRPWSKSDLPLALALWGDPAVTRWIGGPWNEPQVRERLDQEIRSMHARGIQYWPIFLLTTGEHLGCCGLRPYPGDDLTLELGVHLRRDFWGAGLALESARTVIQHGFETLGARALFAGHNPGNESSRRLVARLGFRYLRDEYYPPTGLDHPSYLLTADDYRRSEPDDRAATAPAATNRAGG
ncbi:MAG TPA: GNAT family N-acetyltransferase [Gemmatimonadales bacterium]